MSMSRTIEKPRLDGPGSGLAVVWAGHREAAELYWDQLAGAGLTMAPLEQG